VVCGKWEVGSGKWEVGSTMTQGVNNSPDYKRNRPPLSAASVD